jgi:hypothetical protein
MNKIIKISLSVMAVCFTLLYSCQKNSVDSTKNDEDHLIQVPQQTPIKFFNDLKVKLTVENGAIKFNSISDFKQIINFLSYNSSKDGSIDEIRKWEKSLPNFTSVFKYYELALQELVSDTLNKDGYKNIKLKYSNKIACDDKNEHIKPAIRNGCVFGRIIGENGYYIIDKTINQYYQGKVISIIDGDLGKLENAKKTLVEDKKNGIYIHEIEIGGSASALNTRGTATPTCSNSCPVSYTEQKISDLNGERFRLTQSYTFIDNGGFAGNSRFVIYSVDINIFQQRKRWWGGYSANYAGFSWGFGWGLIIKVTNGSNIWAPVGCCDEGFGMPAGGQGWMVNSNELNISIGMGSLFSDDLIISQQFFFITGAESFCVRRTGLISNSNNVDPSSIDKDLKISQYCQNY